MKFLRYDSLLRGGAVLTKGRNARAEAGTKCRELLSGLPYCGSYPLIFCAFLHGIQLLKLSCEIDSDGAAACCASGATDGG